MTDFNAPAAVPAPVERPEPQDHLKPSDVLAAEALEEAPEGVELLTPVEKLRSRKITHLQAGMFDLFGKLGMDMTADGEQQIDVEPTPDVIRAIGDLSELLEDAVRPEKFDEWVEFDSGPAARERVMNLAMWYLNRLGE
jgi:hypothetical protein